MKRLIVLALAALSICAAAQDAPPPPQAPGGQRGGMQRREFPRVPMAWWKSSEVAQKLNLNDQQQKQLETTFNDYRLKLIDLRAAVQREEVKLQPLVDADQLNANAVNTQIDALIGARMRLEKTTATMGVDMRKILTNEQWKQLREMRGRGMGFGGGPRGPGGDNRRRRGGPGLGPGGPGGPAEPINEM